MKQTKAQVISDTVAALSLHKTITKAAEALKVNRVTIYRRMEEYPEIGEAIARNKQRALEILTNSTDKAADIMVSGLDDNRQKYDSAKYILDGMGITKQQQTNVQVNVLNQIKKDKEEFGI